MQQVEIHHRLMKFKLPSGTSRGILKTKDSWFLELTNQDGVKGVGECSVISGLSPDLANGLVCILDKLHADKELGHLNTNMKTLDKLPALRFAIETAELDQEAQGSRKLFSSDFLSGKGIPINGLVWMGNKQFMYDQIKVKIESGYSCIKIKIAAIDFEEELSLLKYVRSQFSQKDIEIRVDANGGFQVKEAFRKLARLSEYAIHSIEQPIAAGQYTEMAELCRVSPIDIALDEELISISGLKEKDQLLDIIKPKYLILKPSLLGGFEQAKEWISLAVSRNIDWWVTSALEANIGLNAIAQWTASLDNDRHQGLGTGQLFSNNISSPLYIEKGMLYFGNESWGKIRS